MILDSKEVGRSTSHLETFLGPIIGGLQSKGGTVSQELYTQKETASKPH